MVMKKEIKDKWISALRSGEYEQAGHRLHTDNGFCCLGVLCDLAVKEGVIPPPRVGREGYQYGVNDDTSNSTLPSRVWNWAGLSNSNPWVLETGVFPDVTPDDNHSLASLNDQGAPFEQIADIIEEIL